MSDFEDPHLHINITPRRPDSEVPLRWQKPSHLHTFKPIANPDGNRAERRAFKKKLRKKK